mmetsp:Transcript_32134/g.44027  ORF Transcript_32134/g.44027 Transcript_32134/m.44027 type:complete len:258 (+) Transcript_32134:78-851(+)|eukprot:CAMPEP_0201490708 /NCGR_PEP_ID=MMETSP0151_2-20130828/27113_1 /ASSEMBLY_ACC=CAM_ASM_000257 /TAXON_ID=200890 /ORGANISM="Paramoeba atlantica, Strain 621/1 / CCAP 1560/9" /LENGTH=257 /DNA_ID=CAMNT_0047876769 /DNA_START=52 /DNA_END=825 /DNA_ORIENTATION=+
MRSFVFGLVVAILFCGSFASAETFPSYGNAWTAYFSWMEFFPDFFDSEIGFGTSGNGVRYFDLDRQRNKFELTAASDPEKIEVFQFFKNSTQYTVSKDSDTGEVYCELDDLEGEMEQYGTGCVFAGEALVNNRKCNRWDCTLDEGFLLTREYIYTEQNRQQTPLRDLFGFSFNLGGGTDFVITIGTDTDGTDSGFGFYLGSLMIDIDTLRETKPSAKVWKLPSECYGLEPSRAKRSLHPLLPRNLVLDKLVTREEEN